MPIVLLEIRDYKTDTTLIEHDEQVVVEVNWNAVGNSFYYATQVLKDLRQIPEGEENRTRIESVIQEIWTNDSD